MPTILVSSKGQIVLPAELRRRLGMGAGARLEVLEEPDGLKLRVLRPVSPVDPSAMAGMVRAPSRGAPRSLDEFDAASHDASPARHEGRRRQSARAVFRRRP